jgi:serine acetyltransferase
MSNGDMVAADSVITHNVSAHALVAGGPASVTETVSSAGGVCRMVRLPRMGAGHCLPRGRGVV